MAAAGFYVYEHIRRDTGAVFYVGKGSGRRAIVEQRRNQFWRNVAAKAGGYSVRIIAEGLEEELAFLVELELIAKHRSLHAKLTNLTDGGEGGMSACCAPEVIARRAISQRGQKRPSVSAALRGRPKSPEHRANLSNAKRGVPASDAARMAMSLTRRAMQLPLVSCMRCRSTCNLMTAARYHGANCKGEA
jgi:hypothetical protein